MKKLILICILLGLVISQVMQLKKHKKEISNVVTSTGKMTLDNFQNYQYYGNFTVGTPAQNISIVTDTGSNQFWIPITQSGCYNQTASSTANITSTPGSIQYGQGYVAGYMGTEMLGQIQLNLVNLKMTTLFVDDQQQMSAQKACGLMGLSNDESWKNFLQVAVSAGQLADSQFAFKLKNTDQNTYLYAGSNSFPSTYTLTWFPVIVSNYWAISITGTIIDGTTYAQPAGMASAVLDTGTSLVLMAANAYNALLQDAVIASQCSQQQGYVLCPCLGNGFPSVYFQASGHTLQILPTDYMDPLSGSYCMLGFQGMTPDQIPFVILGDVFLRNYFFALDKTNNRIGLYGTGVNQEE